MSEEFFGKIKYLLQAIIAGEQSFYRDKYSGLDLKIIEDLSKDNFSLLPIISKSDLAEAPYKNRCYGEGTGINKLIFFEDNNSYFLIHRTIEEIGKDDLPVVGERPMVILSNVYEAVERCVFFYEKRILPLIGEANNFTVVYATARQYKIDSLFIDHISVEKFRKGLLTEPQNKISHVTVIDSMFLLGDLEWPENIKKAFILSIPEFGRIAFSCPEITKKSGLVLHSYPDVYIEPGALSVLTSSRLWACPMIRYKSTIYMERIVAECKCGLAAFKI